jgi:hypothetical protein
MSDLAVAALILAAVIVIDLLIARRFLRFLGAVIASLLGLLRR